MSGQRAERVEGPYGRSPAAIIPKMESGLNKGGGHNRSGCPDTMTAGAVGDSSASRSMGFGVVSEKDLEMLRGQLTTIAQEVNCRHAEQQ
jgi:hypothetical protein